VEGRTGFDNLIKYVANRLVQSDIGVDAESKSMTPADVAKLIEAFSTSSQRDVALYRKLGGICMKMKPADFTVDDIALILEGFERAGLRDKSLIRHMGAIIQSGLAKDCTPRGIGSLASSLVAGGASEGAALRTLSALAQRIPASEYTAESLGIIWTAFAAAEIRDPPLYRFISSCIEAMDDSLFDANMVARIARAAAKSGMPANDPIYEKLVSAAASLRCSAYTPDTASRIVSAFADGSPQSDKLFKYFALVLKKMDAWTFDIDSVAMVVGAYKRAGQFDASLFARLSTVLQQVLCCASSLSHHSSHHSSLSLSLSILFHLCLCLIMPYTYIYIYYTNIYASDCKMLHDVQGKTRISYNFLQEYLIIQMPVVARDGTSVLSF